MSTKDPNLKVIFGADTSDFDKGAKAVKQGLKDLDKSSASMLSGLSNAFGVPSAKVEQMTSAVRGLGYKLVETGNAGAKAFGSMLASIGPLQAGIAGLGIAAAIAGFKQLKAEADNFKSTIDGMNLSMGTAAYISTYQQVLHDANRENGKAFAETMSSFEKMWARFKANASATVVTWISDKDTRYLANAWKKVSEAADQAEAAAERNEVRASKMADLKKYELELGTKVKENEREIAELRRQSVDTSNDAATRAQAEAKARELVNWNYDKQIQLAKAMSILQVEMDDEAGNTFEETRHTEETKQRILALEEQRAQALQGLDKIENRIAGSTSAAAAAMQKAREEAEKMAEVQVKWSGMADALGVLSGGDFPAVEASVDVKADDGQVRAEAEKAKSVWAGVWKTWDAMAAPVTGGLAGVTGPTMSVIPKVENPDVWKETFTAQIGEVTIGIGFRADTEKIRDITNEVTGLMQDAVMRTGELIGDLVGTLAGGGDAWGDFKNAALSAFGDMAIAIGKIAISAGLASSGIAAALKNPENWMLAVAAGAALVALGSAVKSSLSSVASGDYSAGGGGYSAEAAVGSAGSGYETREVQVYVTGTLEADGDKLITVINNANKKNYYTQ